MAQWVQNLWLEEDGQDLTEYALILTFIATILVALVYSGMPYVNAIWITQNSNLASANTAATGN
jgi:Flp pilus assembly pilin Flp